MATNKKKRSDGGRTGPPGVWNRGTGRGPANPIRVRTKRLDEIEGDRIALAYWLLAKQIVETSSDVAVGDEEARKVAGELEADQELTDQDGLHGGQL